MVNLSEIFIESKDKPPELTKDQDKVHDQIFSFYNKLFAHKECNSNLDDIRSFLGGVSLKQVTELENEKLQEPLSKQEIANFIKTMSNNKAPGFTGITPAFYKVFWNRLGQLVTSAAQNCLNAQKLPSRQ